MTRTVTWETLTNHTSRVVISEPPTADDVRSRFALLGLAGSALEREALGAFCPCCGHAKTYVAVGTGPLAGYATGAVPYGWWLSSVAGGSLP